MRIARSFATLFLFSACAFGQYVTLTGQIQTANGLPLANSALSFSPTQTFFIAGTGVVVPSTSQCATDAGGLVVGVPNPLLPPTVSTVFSGTLSSGTYYVEVAWGDAASHTTVVSPEFKVALASTGSLHISLASPPANATTIQVYIGTTSGGETLQGHASPSAVYNQSVPLVTGSAVPSSNNTLCNIVANDAGWPTGTGYVVDWTTTAGNTLPGYPMQWQLLGPGTTINLSQGIPKYNGVVQYPVGILAQPQGHGTQSISGNLSLGQYELIAGNINGSCILTSTIATAVACAGTNGTIEVPPNTSASITGNTTIPAGVNLLFDGGACINANGFTLTINGSIVAPVQQIFCGSGTVTGLSRVLPEWFGATNISLAVEGAFNQTNGGTLVLQPNVAYTNAFTTGAPGWSLSNVTIQGAGKPYSNTAFTQLLGGSVIQGGMEFCGASNVAVSDVGFDVGSVVAGTSTTDGIAFQGASECVGAGNPAEPLIQNIRLNHVTCMLSSGAVQFHCARIEHANNWSVNDLTMYFGTHGFALKSLNGIGTNITGYGEGNDCVIVKADAYTATAHDIFNNISCSTLSNANVLAAGLIYDAENGGALQDIHTSDLVVTNATFGMKMSSNFNFGPSAMDNVSVSNFKYKVDTSYSYSTTIQCLELDGLGANTYTNVHFVGTTCVNETGLTFFPMNMTIPMVGVFDSTVISGSNSNGSLIAGTSVTFNGYTELNATNSKPFTLGTSGYNLFVSGYSSPIALSNSAIAAGAAINPKGGAGNGFGIANGDGIYGSALSCTTSTNGPGCTVVSSTSTPTLMVGTGANAGLLRVRDNTSGASALFMIDPNGGATSVAGTITGLAAGGITFSSGQWHFTLTSGTTPRALFWTIYD